MLYEHSNNEHSNNEHSNNALFIGNSGNNCKSLTHKRQWCCQYFHLLMTQTQTFLTYDTFKMHYNTSGAVIVNNDYFFKKFRRSHLYDRMQCVNDFNKFLVFVKACDDRDLWQFRQEYMTSPCSCSKTNLR